MIEASLISRRATAVAPRSARDVLSIGRIPMSLSRTCRSQYQSDWHLSYRSLLRPVCIFALLALVFVSSGVAVAQQTYRKPPKEVLDVLDAPLTPSASVSPARDYMLL